MKRSVFAVFLLAAAALVCAPLLLRTPSAAKDPAPLSAKQNNARAQAPGEDNESLLFPELDDSAVTAVSIKSPDSSFEFLCENKHDVSVNGRRADSEIFRTLVSQIAEIAVTPADPFPEGSELLLFLSVTAGGAQYNAAFFADGKDGAHAYIKSGGSAPNYHRTAGWRVGTLMMTCEGTRIQDERGNEPPAD